LADDAGAGGAHGGANSHLPLPAQRTGEQQVRHVDAGDNQDAAHRAEQHQQRGAHGFHIVVRAVILQRHYIAALACDLFGMLLLEAPRDAVDLGTGLFHAHAWREPAEYRQHVAAVAL